MIRSSTPCSSASPPQHHGEPGSHWLHQEFHTPASSFSTVMSRTIPSSPSLLSICSCSPSSSSSSPFLNHRPDRLLSASRCQPQPRFHSRSHRNDTPIICICWHRQSHSVRRILGYYSSPQSKQAQACWRYLSTLFAAWPCAASGKRKRLT